MVFEYNELDAIAAWNQRAEQFGNSKELPEWLVKSIETKIEKLYKYKIPPAPYYEAKYPYTDGKIEALEWVLSLKRDQ